MFEQLFTYRGVVSRHRETPLVQERERYLAARAAVGLAPDTLRNLAQELRIIAQTFELPDGGPIDTVTINVAAERWVQSQLHGQNSKDRQGPRVRFVRVATEWFRFLGRLDEPEGEAAPFTVLIEAFATCMHRERGLSSKTLSKYTWFARQFCQWFSTQDRLFSDVIVGDVDAFLKLCGQRWCRVSVATAAKALRTFFRYAEHRQWCAAGIAAAIESPRLFQQETLPTGPTWSEVQQLLAQTLTERPRDIRDHAILMLFVIYGLRSGEVSALRFDQLDWAHEQITIVRPKQHCSQLYPLTQAMGTALIRYLREVRPRCERREIFLTLRAPWRPLSTGALHHLTRTRLAQVGYVGQHDGPHTLRHACAAQVIRDYVDLKQAMGSRFHSEVVILKAFSRSVGDLTITEVTAEQANAYLAGHGPVTRFWHRKYSALQGFYRFAIGRGYVNRSPLPATTPKPQAVFTPYIYSPEELRRLLQAADACEHPRSKLSATTVRTLVRLLYGAALRISEALMLKLADVDLAASLLTIHTSKFYKTRWVPIGPRLSDTLAAYAHQRPQEPPLQSPEAPFLLTRTGKPVTRQQAERVFRRLCERAAVLRNDGTRYQPRLHDLRHTWAVHRLVAWYEEGADVQRLLPHLATYLGHVHIAATQCYLTMTPALLQAASLRFEQYAQPEVHHG